jgi:hypothetical protein
MGVEGADRRVAGDGALDDATRPPDAPAPDAPAPCQSCRPDQVCVNGECTNVPMMCPCPLETYCDLGTNSCVVGCTRDDQCSMGRTCDESARRCRDIPDGGLPPSDGGAACASPSCSNCTMRPGCGWCADEGACREGTQSGPATGTCSGWDWFPTSCPGFDGGLGDLCTAFPLPSCAFCVASPFGSCGWCADDDTCRTGAASGPSQGSCRSWEFGANSCSTGADGGSATDGGSSCVSSSCSDCTARATCGWCADNDTCRAGTSSGPTTGTCSRWDWLSTSCPGAADGGATSDPCTAFPFTSCAFCTAFPLGLCGWCADDGTCRTGATSGPSVGTCTRWTFGTASCPADTDGGI